MVASSAVLAAAGIKKGDSWEVKRKKFVDYKVEKAFAKKDGGATAAQEKSPAKLTAAKLSKQEKAEIRARNSNQEMRANFRNSNKAEKRARTQATIENQAKANVLRRATTKRGNENFAKEMNTPIATPKRTSTTQKSKQSSAQRRAGAMASSGRSMKSGNQKPASNLAQRVVSQRTDVTTKEGQKKVAALKAKRTRAQNKSAKERQNTLRRTRKSGMTPTDTRTNEAMKNFRF